eukprot:12245-Heterococcus_DN1.PRE.2
MFTLLNFNVMFNYCCQQRGPYCSVCSDGYSKSMTGTCQQCTARSQSANIAIAIVCITILLAAGVAVYLNYTKVKARSTDGTTSSAATTTYSPSTSPRSQAIVHGSNIDKNCDLVQQALDIADILMIQAHDSAVSAVRDSMRFVRLVLLELATAIKDSNSLYTGLGKSNKQHVINVSNNVHEALILLISYLESLKKTVPAVTHNSTDLPAGTVDESTINSTLSIIQVVVAGIIDHDCKLRQLLPQEVTTSFTSIFKVSVTFYQIMGAMQSVFIVQFPPTVAPAMQLSDFVNLSFLSSLSLDCFGTFNFYSELLFKTIAPLIIAALLWCAYFTVKFLPRVTSNTTVRTATLNKIIGAFLILTYTVLPGVASSIFKAFTCEQFDDGSVALRADYSIACDTQQYKFMVVYAAVM